MTNEYVWGVRGAMTLLEEPVEGREPAVADGDGPAKRPSSIRLRPIELGDADAVFGICKRAHEKTPAKVFQFSRKRFDGHLTDYFERKNTQASIVAEFGERVVGMVWVKCGTFTYADEGKVASIVTLNVDHENTGPFQRARVFLTLLSAAKAMADKWGALQVTIHTTTGGQAGNADRLLKRRGAKLVGGNYLF